MLLRLLLVLLPADVRCGCAVCSCLSTEDPLLLARTHPDGTMPRSSLVSFHPSFRDAPELNRHPPTQLSLWGTERKQCRCKNEQTSRRSRPVAIFLAGRFSRRLSTCHVIWDIGIVGRKSIPSVSICTITIVLDCLKIRLKKGSISVQAIFTPRSWTRTEQGSSCPLPRRGLCK